MTNTNSSALTVRCDPSSEDVVADFLADFSSGAMAARVSVVRSELGVFSVRGEAFDLRFLATGLSRISGVTVRG